MVGSAHLEAVMVSVGSRKVPAADREPGRVLGLLPSVLGAGGESLESGTCQIEAAEMTH